ncbi:sulfatase family protein [Planctopirus hydrillae]|uniref:Arylsulfatase n=1 Tax=Planctopirus hydrillae TaxID=1841610 RepID=A0A1C3EP02_9PLAN|nr:arylsulfatase [Planctopirus hydrillae]ODA34970.1 arylsulfatase [Planctopirus hydrillae]
MPLHLAMTLLILLIGSSWVQAAPPNIVILYADDMGYGDLHVQNPESRIPTPNLDRLARQGTRFTDAHSSSGICTPSRYALLQGRYHWRKFHGIVNSFDSPVLDDEKLTIAKLLKTKGYRTACIGKWHLGWDWNSIKKQGVKPTDKAGYAADAFDWSQPISGGPRSHGFDYYFGDDVPNFPPYAWFENDRVITTPTVTLKTTAPTAEGSWEARPGPAVQDWDFWAVMPTLTQKAEQWISEQKADQPFFLYFPFTSPHAPIVPTSDFTGKSQAGGYGDFMFQTDDTVGRVLAALEKHGFSENTLVIFSADNGPERYAYDRVRNFGHRSMGPLRGLKRDIWEGGHRVPMIVRWPGVVPAERVCDELISQIDLFATIAAVVDAEIPPGSAEDSYNQLQLLQGTGSSARQTLVHNTHPKGYALRHGDWVLIDARTGAVSQVPKWFDEANGYSSHSLPGELYHLKDDLAQRQNLYAENPEKVAELKALLGKIQAQGQVR